MAQSQQRYRKGIWRQLTMAGREVPGLVHMLRSTLHDAQIPLFELRPGPTIDAQHARKSLIGRGSAPHGRDAFVDGPRVVRDWQRGQMARHMGPASRRSLALAALTRACHTEAELPVRQLKCQLGRPIRVRILAHRMHRRYEMEGLRALVPESVGSQKVRGLLGQRILFVQRHCCPESPILVLSEEHQMWLLPA